MFHKASRSNKSWADLTDEAKLTRNEEKTHMQVQLVDKQNTETFPRLTTIGWQTTLTEFDNFRRKIGG